MHLGKNIRFLRKKKHITQEEFGTIMGVSRQTVSKWESDEAIPELNKLITMADVFSTKLDNLIRDNLESHDEIYSSVRHKTIDSFDAARYMMISAFPERDLYERMTKWAETSGLTKIDPEVRIIGGRFPFVSQQQKSGYGLRGYDMACILPEGFEIPEEEGAPTRIHQIRAKYVMLTIHEPLKDYDRVPQAYNILLESLGADAFLDEPKENILPYFEIVYEVHGVQYMDVYVNVDSVVRTNALRD